MKASEEMMKSNSMYIAFVVRNEMEDFHVKHLSDAQMEELNPIIRNAIFKAILFAGIPNFRLWNQPPAYWEEPFVSEADRAFFLEDEEE